MIDHLGINCADLEASKAFYDGVLGVLGYGRIMDFGEVVGYGGKDGKPDFWIGHYAGQPETQRELHLAFEAPGKHAVDAFHAKAIELGAESLHEPRLRPEYHPGYYGAFVRDPDGNNVEAVIHDASG
ncbi:MAG: VOC family protein [Micromonosporaceae bacterium]|nr:VOC family protein [Micromonosporaceae bacterium]